MPPERKTRRSKKARYSPLPSYEEYVKHEDAWDNLRNVLDKFAAKRAQQQNTEKVEKERAEWRHRRTEFGDPFKKLMKQARDPANWILENPDEFQCDNKEEPDEEKGDNGERCYLRINLSRRHAPHRCHRLQGTQDVYLCWMCITTLPRCLKHSGVHDSILLAAEDMEQPPSLLDASKDPENWVEENEDTDKCVSRSNCWYQGNQERAGCGTMHRLKATPDVYLCDVCFDNGGFDKVEDEIAAILKDDDDE